MLHHVDRMLGAKDVVASYSDMMIATFEHDGDNAEKILYGGTE